MRELLYTKRSNDYAHIILEDGKEISIRSFEGIEDSLKETSEMGLPFSNEVDGTYAYYFNTDSGELWRVNWCYSTYGDPRGYVESRYKPIPNNVLGKLRITDHVLKKLCALLVHTFMLTKSVSSKFHKYNLSKMFPDEEMSEELIRAFLYLYYLFLPTHFSNDVLFINWRSNVECDMVFELDHVSGADRVCSTQNFDPSALELIHHIENIFEYQVLFEATIRDVFHCSVSFPLDRKTQPLYVRIQRVLNLWHKVNVQTWTSQNCLNLIRCRLKGIFNEEINNLRNIKDFHELLDEYQKILLLLNKPENSASLELCERGFLFRNYHTADAANDKQTYLSEAFQVMSVLGDRILDEDRKYYSDLCLTYICQAQTGRDLIKLIGLLGDYSVRDFFTIITVPQEHLDEVKELYQCLSQDVLQNMDKYHGYCNDPAFHMLKAETDAVMELADVFGFDLRVFLFEQYGAKLQNTMQFQNMCSFFLDERITLDELMQLLEDWTIGDCFTKLNLTLYDIMIETLKRYSMDSGEKEKLLICLMLYKAFRMDYDDLIEYSGRCQDLSKRIAELQEKHSQLIPSMGDVYNSCKDKIAIKILLFLEKNIAANPAILLFMMDAYQQYYIESDQENFDSYVAFLNLIFLPLIVKQKITLQECCDLIAMYKQSYNPSSKAAKGDHTLLAKSDYKLRQFVKKTGYAIEKLALFRNHMPVFMANRDPEYIVRIGNMLGEKYAVSEMEKAVLDAEIVAYNDMYRRLISGSQLNITCGNFIEIFRKYIMDMIYEI